MSLRGLRRLFRRRINQAWEQSWAIRYAFLLFALLCVVSGCLTELIQMSLTVRRNESRAVARENHNKVVADRIAAGTRTYYVGRNEEWHTLQSVIFQEVRSRIRADAGFPPMRIIVRDNLEESPRISLRGDKRVSIEADPGKKITWTSSDSSLLTIIDCQDITVRGFILDGGGRMDHLACLVLRNPGVTLDGITFRGYRRSGIALFNCAGTPGEPVRINNCRFLGFGNDNIKFYLMRELIDNVAENVHISVSP